MSEEKINETGVRKPGRPRKTVSKTNISKTDVNSSTGTTKNDSDTTTKFKKNITKAPRTTNNKREDVPQNMPKSVDQNASAKTGSESNGTGSATIENKPRALRGRPKVANDYKKNVSASTEKVNESKFEHVSTEYVFDLTQENQEREDNRPKRKPGRPVKKQDRQQPILSLHDSGRVPHMDKDRHAEKQETLAIASHGRRALDKGNKYALEENSNRALPAKLGDTQVTGNSEARFEEKTENNFRPRAYKGKNPRPNSMNNRGAKPNEKRAADFVAGTHGTSAYAGPDSLGGYGEKAALGVMGIIDEAPSVDALLPLVMDSDAENDSKSSRRSRSRRRPKDKLSDKYSDKLNEKPTDKQPREKPNGKQSKPKAKQATDVLEAGLNYEAPIAEGGDLSRIEAEATIKKHTKTKKESSAKVEHVNRVLYVSSVPDEQVEVVITENGVVSEYFVEMAHQAKIRGNIYKGIINNVDTNLQAAFVNFGGGKNGFLQIDEVHPEYWLTHHTEGGKYPPIQKVLKIGQEVLVQVVKEPSGSKGAFLTTWISLAGRFIVLTPGQEQIGVSRKVEDALERSRLRDLLVGINPGENMGVIIRTASEGASKSNIQSDLKFLQRAWVDIQTKVVDGEAPCLIYQEADLASRAVRDYLSEDIDEVWVDSEEVRDTLQGLVSVIFPKGKDVLKLHRDTRHTLWERFNILRQLEEVTKREVVLPSGGRLVFDQTEALMAIDINSGKTQGKINFESMVFRTNMEAVEAIARHLRLRDIGGQVVIDFIEMRDRGHCREVEKNMRNSMKRDRARHDVGRLSSFGLLELVRQRTGTSAISISSEPCPHCKGTGFRRNLEWQSQGVLREIKSKLSGKNVPTCYVHHAEQEVAFYLLNNKRDRLSELESKFNVKVEIQIK